MERTAGIEPATSTVAWWHSPSELHPHVRDSVHGSLGPG